MRRFVATNAWRALSGSAFRPIPYRTYVAVVGGTISVCLLAVMAANLVAIRYNLFNWHFASLLSYQIEKLSSGPPIDVLLVGDSSLGNAIDARRWASAEGIEVVSVALTGAYGYAGSLQMLKRAVRSRGVRLAMIVQTPDMLTRVEDHEGALFAATDMQSVLGVPLSELLPRLLSKELTLHFLSRLRRGPEPIAPGLRRSDYVPQRTPVKVDLSRAVPFEAARLRPEKAYYLRRIVEFCRDAGLSCVYAYGPIADPFCRDDKGYYTAGNRIIRETGIALLTDRPPCISADDIGDSLDHVRPAAKAAFTEVYRALLKTVRSGAASWGRRSESARL